MTVLSEITKDKLVIFSKDKCKYCFKSKELLTNFDIPFTEIKLDPENEKYLEKRDTLKEKSNGHNTFPFIFIGKDFLGGFSELNHSVSTTLSTKLKKIGINFNNKEDDF